MKKCSASQSKKEGCLDGTRVRFDSTSWVFKMVVLRLFIWNPEFRPFWITLATDSWEADIVQTFANNGGDCKNNRWFSIFSIRHHFIWGLEANASTLTTECFITMEITVIISNGFITWWTSTFITISVIMKHSVLVAVLVACYLSTTCFSFINFSKWDQFLPILIVSCELPISPDGGLSSYHVC